MDFSIFLFFTGLRKSGGNGLGQFESRSLKSPAQRTGGLYKSNGKPRFS
jgi:hypothetical protein